MKQQHPQQQEQRDFTTPRLETLTVESDILPTNNSNSNIIPQTKFTRGAVSVSATATPLASSTILLSSSSQHSTGSARERRRLNSSGNSNSNSTHNNNTSHNNNNKTINNTSDHSIALNGNSHHSIISDPISEESESGHERKRLLSDGDLASPSKQSSLLLSCASFCSGNMSMGNWNSIKVLVLIVLSLQNSLFTVLRRYSQGILREEYSKYEVLLAGEIIKMLFSAFMIRKQLLEHTASSNVVEESNSTGIVTKPDILARLQYLLQKSGKMVGLALIYGAMNILSFVSLRNIGAGLFTVIAQCKILTTASFSTLLLQRRYSWVKWRALVALIFGVLLFSEPIWGNSENLRSKRADANLVIGVSAVIIEVTLSGFASIYFEKVVKTDPLQLTIWERNFQLAFVRLLIVLLCFCCFVSCRGDVYVCYLFTNVLFCLVLLYIPLAGILPRILGVHGLGRWGHGGIFRWLVSGCSCGYHPGRGGGSARGTFHQVRGCHSENTGDHGRHHLVVCSGCRLSWRTSLVSHGHCGGAGCDLHYELHV
jgi:Nucleotide-sugar transporter